MCESTASTTANLEMLLERHVVVVEHAIVRFGLPLHVLFLEQVAEAAAGYLDVAGRRYPKTLAAFASKSNPCRGAIRAAHRLGLGIDAASEFELRAAIEEGIPPENIICNGNAKSDDYLRMAAHSGALIAIDNADELTALDALHTHAEPARILVRFRGMPLAGLTSDDQTTAADWTKFGFHIDEAADVFARIIATPRLRFTGVSAHIGTQIARPIGYERLVVQLLSLAQRAQEMGLPVEAINLGGGFPVRFLTESEWEAFTDRLLARVLDPSPDGEAVTWNDLPMGYAHLAGSPGTSGQWIGKAYWTQHPGARMLEHLLQARLPDGRTAVERLRDLGEPRLIVEPGRSLMASAGVTITRTMGTKRVLGHHVVALDMGINNHGTNLISPDIFPAAALPRRATDRPIEAFLAGRLCFSGDMISKAKVRLNRLPKRGERLVLFHTGAYSADHFASNSCGFPRPAKVAVRTDGTLEVWRRRESFEDVFGSGEDPPAPG